MSIHTIRLATHDGETLTFDCGEDETVVAAAARANLTVPILCGQGSCGTCRGTCGGGDYVLGEHNPGALSTDDAKAGHVLLCRTFPRGPLDITVPFEARALAGAVQEREAEITALDDLGGRTLRLALTLRPDADDSTAAQFEPGQFMELRIPGTDTTRAYSLSNTANWSGELEFLIRLQPGGLFSGWLEREARVGQVISLRGPQGTFGLRENGLRPRWFVAGGTGLAPMLSMLRRMAEWGDPQPARLYFGVSTEADLFGAVQIAEIQAALPGLQVIPCVWKPGPGWTGFAGSPVDALARDLPGAPTPDIYLCGPPALIDAATAMATAHGVPVGNIMAERFLPS
ncbi:FAD-binding oxidoreductase [Novispirillum sp. DQ9]|uniref:FAD-binding oxidoreductase n=1 Tax=Novispirillum sp. DQ9 TaxID=3398612 RepID=UPI003C7BE9FD